MDLTNHTSTALTFTENHHGNVVLSKLYEQLAEGKYCDVVLHVQDRTYSAHRCVLASCSPFFEAAFRESATDKDHVSINSHNLETFETVFVYMYTGNVMIDFSTVSEILRLANYLMLRELKGYCIGYLERSLQVNNVYFTQDIADKWNLEALSKTVHGFILANLLDVIEQEEILQFDEYRMEAFISNKSYPLMEDIRLHIICKWVMEDVVSRHPAFQKLTTHLQWTRLTLDKVYNALQTERLFLESEFCVYYLLKLLQDRVLLLPLYIETLNCLEKKVKAGQTKEQLLLSQQKQQQLLMRDNEKITSVETLSSDPVDDLDEPKLLLVDQNIGDKGSLIIDEDSNDIPLEYASDGDVEPSAPDSESKGDDLLESTIKVPPNDNHGICKLDMDVSDTALHQQEEKTASEESLDLKCDQTLATDRDKHKRKGLPVKLKIPKSRLQKTLINNNPKRRGRPVKNMESKTRTLPKRGKRKASQGTGLQNMTSKTVKQEVLSSKSDSVASGDDDIHDNNEALITLAQGKTRKPIKPEKITKSKRVRVQKKRGDQRRKKLKQEKKSAASLQCEHCSSKFEDSLSLLAHLQLSHKDAANYVCSKCGFSSLWNKVYYKHMRTHFSGPPYKCDYEGCEHSTERIQPLIYHRMRHTDERPFLCTTCNLKFRTKNNLNMHIRSHTGEKPWRCDVCSRNFATKGTLEQHSVIHSQVRPYLCDTCGFSTKFQSHLIAHKRIHTGDVFRCQYADCKYSTPKRSQLACHMRSHMSIRQHICATCRRAFVEKSHLVRHERIHLDDKPFKCPQCDYSSARRDKLKEHTNKYHGEKAVKSQYKPRKPRKQSFDPQAFPDYSQEGAMRVQEEFNGRMEKSVQERNQVHSQIIENRDRLNKSSSQQQQLQQSTAVTTAAPTTNELNQIKDILLSAEVAMHMNTQASATNENAVVAGATFSGGDNQTPMVIEPNSAGGNILLGNVAFALDSRNNLGFIQTQGGIPPQTGPNIVTSGLQALPQVSHDNLSAMVSYANLGAPGGGQMPLIALPGGQTVQATTADLNQLTNLPAGLF